ncbi:hypothetical protein ABW09_24545 [Pluralibacter gergoviae]|nr:hypothetical protein ABW09_24545 [Pluralibacter gergoviae]
MDTFRFVIIKCISIFAAGVLFKRKVTIFINPVNHLRWTIYRRRNIFIFFLRRLGVKYIREGRYPQGNTATIRTGHTAA